MRQTRRRFSFPYCMLVIIQPTDASMREAKFSYDKVFGPGTSQQEIFEYVGKPLLQSTYFSVTIDAMNGYNATVFAYGQTSSGKTFTMEGRSLDDQEFKGLIPRVMDEVFELIMAASDKFEFTLRVTMLEIYNEKIQDLLDSRLQLTSIEKQLTSARRQKTWSLCGRRDRAVC